MEKPHSPLRKTSHPRKQLPSKVAREGEEPRFKLQKTPTKDQCCQTEQQHECQAVGTDADLKSPVHSVEPGDPPLLQQQLQTSKSGIQQIIECFRSGTAQLKHILLREVDTIFECKLCRSLFRGLPNLITHKEFYCFPNLLDVNDPPSDNKQSKAIKELLEAIYPRKDQPEYVVRLEPIESNQNAVFQFVSREDDQVPAEQETVCPPVPEVARVQPEKNLEREELVVEPVEPVEPTVEEELPGEEEASAPHGEPEPETRGEEEAVIASGLDGVRIACSLCGKEFSSWKAVQRHCHKVHEGRLEELRKLMGTRTLPLSLLSIVKHWPRRALGAAGRSCPVCRKSFATNANVRRHFDEVHRGLRRDSVTSYAATGPRQPLRLEAPAHMRRQRSGPQFNLSACRCLLCKRKYSSQVMLKKHMRIVHKIRAPENGPSPGAAPEVSDQNDGEKDKRSAAEKKKPKKELESPKVHKSKLSLGFDFRQLYCKLCKRQFTSKQNLTKHIELHTDGDDIYIKFYCCPICSYESRRKRDVIRHITVVHKKPASYLDKIVPTLEMRAVRKLAELVLNRPMRRGPQKEDVNGQHSPPAAGSHKHETPCGSPASCRQDTPEGAVDVKVTKRMLHACDECGRAFAKKRYLESHRRIHRPKNSRPKRCRTRSKALL